MKNTVLLVIGFVLCLLVVGCAETPNPSQTNTNTYTFASDANIHTFSTEEELEAFLANAQPTSYYSGFGRGVMMDTAVSIEADMAESAVPLSGDGASAKGSADYSQTNVQVEGVDEGDIIKTDGEYIYTATGNTVFIVHAFPKENIGVETKLDIGANVNGMFINDDKLIVFANRWNAFDILPQMNSGFSEVLVYDISDKTNPNIEKNISFEGSIRETRMKGDSIYVVTQSSSYIRDGYPMPIMYEAGEIMPVDVADIRYIGIPYYSSMFVTVYKMDLANYNIESESLVTENDYTVYMSHENLYVGATKYVEEYRIRQEKFEEVVAEYLTAKDKELIKKINAVDADVLTTYEKEQKIQQVHYQRAERLSADQQEQIEDAVEKETKAELDKVDYFTTTQLTRIDLDSLDVEATGEVPGRLYGQFAMDEKDDVLRIATTIPQRWSYYADERTESQNHVYTLDADLDVLDSITGIAETEQIYSTRFIDERLYMVTFRQVDPFYVVDLADPEDIEILGELKIPGFSRYLHPYSEDVIIGIGQDADEDTGRTEGLKISLFDVSDVSNPTEITSYIGDKYSNSNAQYEHKAFLVNREKNLLVIPVYSYNYREDGESYNGAFVFDISEDAIELRGLVNHETGGRYWSSVVERSLYIEDLLYTKSPTLIRVNDLNDLSSVANVTLSADLDFEIY